MMMPGNLVEVKFLFDHLGRHVPLSPRRRIIGTVIMGPHTPTTGALFPARPTTLTSRVLVRAFIMVLADGVIGFCWCYHATPLRAETP